ncbi:FHA domain-containing protein [Candidatus Binatus sp.]|uniref:FHA domain-containing protein n=2 Tax=Candidatus Binatus sp. TaxID=2811406 RepID=UPI003C7855A1
MLKRPQAARLLAVDREAVGTRLLLLGRDEAHVGSADGSGLRIADASVAGRHAVIRYARGRYYVVDLKSAEGTYLNGRRIRRKQELTHGDTVRFGGAAPYRFIDPDALKRRRWRRNLRASAIIAVLVALALVDHYEKLGLFSAALTEIAALAHPQATSRPVAAPATVAANAPTRVAAPSAQATSIPGPAAYVANVAPTAHPRAARTPRLPVSAPKMPASSPTTNVSASSSMSWLERLNFYRAGLGLDPVSDNPKLSAGAAAHARYLLLNFGDDIRNAKPMSADAYEEKPDKSGYSASGAAAASNLQIAWGCSSFAAGQQIDYWIEGPFHRLAMLDPFLADAGFGEASSDGCWAATLRLPPPPEEVKPYARAVEFPPDGAAVALDWPGVETPDPLASCSGYTRPVGLPITLQIGRLVNTRLSAHSLTEDGKPIEYCAFDAPGYRNPNATAQEYGRWSLRASGAVVIVPRAPLQPGSLYAVSITTNDTTYAWSFTAAEAQTTTFAAIAKFPTEAPAPSETATPRPRRTARAHRATPAATASVAMPEIPASAMPPISPMAAETPAVTGSSMGWLAVVNLYRSRLNVPPVEEDPALSQGCGDHAKYLVTNYESMLAGGWNPGGLMHTEDESKPGYTPDGIKAARASDVMFQPPERFTDDERMTRAIESWIAGPFHRPSIANPDLRRVGFGEYCGKRVCAAALDWRSELPPALPGGHPYPTAIEVPPGGATVKPSGFGNEWPSPISPCPGYPYNAPAITLQVGINMAATLADASLTQMTGAAAGTKVATCAYDFQKYTNPDRGTQAHGREVLRGFGEVVMMVRDPLIGGASYRVDMTVNGKPYSWSITAAP